ncbi:MAG: Rpn family recombination-promoting nuclease/putative transposase [Abditibacteriales bacterium]|nr:Rpn family recombination-promoting nuclease/putative transposase [Abditibacteriales bacterium]
MQKEVTSHDQLFKDLLRGFFREFMELFFPDAAGRLDFSTVVFLDKEVFTDLPSGRQRTLDLVAQVQTYDGQRELVLIHVEVESQPKRRPFGRRMLNYYMMLSLRHQLPVFPVVVYLARGAGGLGTEIFEESLFGRRVLTFEYHRVGVADLPAEAYLSSRNPLAYGLAALMQPGRRRPAELKVSCLLGIARALVDEARKGLLVNCVETYLRLDESEQALYEQLVEQPEQKEVKEMLTVYEERGMQRGIAIGEQRGIALGTVRGKREATLRLLRGRFGKLPKAVEAQVKAMESEAELDALFDAALTAPSLEELGFKRQRKRRTSHG